MELKERRREKAFRSYKTTWRKLAHRYLLDKPKCPEGVHPESKRSIPLPQECINPPGGKSLEGVGRRRKNREGKRKGGIGVETNKEREGRGENKVNNSKQNTTEL